MSPLLFLVFPRLPPPQIRRPLPPPRSAAVQPRQYFQIGAPRSASRHRSSLHVTVLHNKNNLLAIFVTHGIRRNQRSRSRFSLLLHRRLAQKRNLHSHVRKNARIEFQERNPHFHSRLLPVRRWN